MTKKLPYFQMYSGDYISSRLFYEDLEINGFYLKVKAVMSRNEERYGFLCEDSKPLSPGRVALRIPGSSPESCLSLLEKLVRLGTLQKTPDGMYFDPALLEQEEKRISSNLRQKKHRRGSVTLLSRVTPIENEYDNERVIASRVKQFIKPTVDEVNKYALSINFKIDAEHFINYYDVRGWMVGKGGSRVKMSDWRGAVRTWMRRAKAQELANSRPAVEPETDKARAFLEAQNAK